MRIRLALFLLIAFFNAFSGAFVSMAMPGADSMVRLATMGGDAVMAAMALLVLWRNREFYGNRLFGIFLLTVVVTLIYNNERIPAPYQLNGLRQPLFFFATLVVTYDLFHPMVVATFERLFTLFAIVFAVAQMPLSVVQFIAYGPGDKVGGSFGTAGGTGVVSLLLFLVAFFLIVRYASLSDGSHFKIGKALLFLPLLIPCALNETKVSFILLPVFFLVMISTTKRMLRAVPLMLFGLVLAYLLNYYYSENVEDTSKVFDQGNLEHYLFYGKSYYTDIPRFQKLSMMLRMMSQEPATYLTGFGWGLFSGGAVMDASRFARSVSYFSGSRMLIFTIWIQGGVLALGTVLAAGFWYLRIRPAPALFTVRRFSLFIALALLAMLFYNEALIDRTFAVIVSFFMLWARLQPGSETEQQTAEETTESHETAPAH